MKPRATLRCPVCGAPMTRANMRPHVGSDPCLFRMARNGQRFADPKRGPRALKLANELDAVALQCEPAASGGREKAS